MEAGAFFAGGKAPANIPDSADGSLLLQQLDIDNDQDVKPTYFVSLFDYGRNIPFYSAYKVTPEQAALIGTASGAKYKWRRPASKFCE